MKIQMVIATHKETALCQDALYVPVHAGAEVHDYLLPYCADNTGDHISGKNAGYCELTALYWAWKNLDADYLGLCHYRRYLCGHGWGSKESRILKLEQAEQLLCKAPILLPKQRNYYIETNYSQYAHAHHGKDLDMTREIVAQSDADGRYTAAFDAVMQRTKGHRFNMFLMRRDLLENYCTWLFGILSSLESKLDTGTYDPYNARVFGFIGERLLDVWLEANHETYLELPYVFIGSENWPVKIYRFLQRKLKAAR